MQGNAVLVCDTPDGRERLECTHLVVGVHDGNQDRLRGDRLLDVIRIHLTIPIHG